MLVQLNRAILVVCILLWWRERQGEKWFQQPWKYLAHRDLNNPEKKCKLEFELESKKNMKYKFGKCFILKINKLTFVYKDKIQILQI